MLLIKRITLLIVFAIFCCSTEVFGTHLVNKNDENDKYHEGTYLYTDREIYIAGENLFFKLFVVDKESNEISQESKIAYIVIRNELNLSVLNVHVHIYNGIAYGSIYLQDTLSTGYYQLLAYTNCMRNGNDSDYFSKELFIANRFDKELYKLFENKQYGHIYNIDTLNSKQSKSQSIEVSLLSNKSIFNPRDKVDVKIKIRGLDSTDCANLLVSVYEREPAGSLNMNIRDYFNRMKKNINPADKVNNLPGKNNECKYIPENKGDILQGTAINKRDSSKLQGACVYLSTEDTIANLKYDITDSYGNFKFLLGDYYEGKVLNVKVKSENDQDNVRFLFDNKFELHSKFRPECFESPSLLRDYILESQNIIKVQKDYALNYVIKDKKYSYHSLHDISFAPVYDFPTEIIHPSDFFKLPDFLEIAKEEPNPTSLSIRKRHGKYECHLFNTNISDYMDSEPFIFLDGILIDNISQILELNSDQINWIECVGRQRVIGNVVADGILSITSTNNKVSSLKLSNNARIKLEFPVPVSKFGLQKEFNESERFVPDFRQLLYWDPYIDIHGNAEKSIEFTTSDKTGIYVIHVEGLTTKGQTIQSEILIRIE